MCGVVVKLARGFKQPSVRSVLTLKVRRGDQRRFIPQDIYLQDSDPSKFWILYIAIKPFAPPNLKADTNIPRLCYSGFSEFSDVETADRIEKMTEA